jgi:hypothetical protein
MNIDELMTYQDITEYLKKKKRKTHLLLGNGFSMAYDKSIFSYNALSSFVTDSDDEDLKKLFISLNTKNFETIMQQLDVFVEIAKIFDIEDTIIDKICKKSDALKNGLIEAVKGLHPEHVFTIPEEKSKSCFEFLRDYLEYGGCVFSTNYDLLLYWVLMRNATNDAIDGFGRELENQSDEFEPNWEPEFSEALYWGIHKDNQNIFYLHGTLPIFDTGIEIIKETYTKKDNKYLLENIERRMNNKEYPVFVTAGNADEKLRHIAHNKYLTYCFDKFCSIDGSLVTFGFCFGDNDTHIINAINKAAKQPINSRLRSIYIGVYSDLDLQHIEKIKDKFMCKVNLYNAKTVNIWNHED